MAAGFFLIWILGCSEVGIRFSGEGRRLIAEFSGICHRLLPKA